MSSTGNMTLREAELVLHLNRPYTKDDMNHAYRNLIRICHPDVGGDNAGMVMVNQAKEVIADWMARHGDTVTDSNDNDNDEKHPAYQHKGKKDPEPSYYGMENDENRNTGTNKHNTDDSHLNPDGTDSTKYYAYYYPTTTPLPMRIIIAMLSHFPWRTAFLVIVMMTCLPPLMAPLTIEISIGETFVALILVLLSVFNLLTGLVTLPLKKLCEHFASKLKMKARRRPASIDY